MEYKKPSNPFEDVHKKAQDAIEHAREVREKEAELRRKKAEEGAIREGSRVPDPKLPL
jgi:hypothetical protein